MSQPSESAGKKIPGPIFTLLQKPPAMPTKLVHAYLALGYVGDEEEQSQSVISFSFFPAVVIQTIKDCMAQRQQTAQDTPD